MLRIKFQRRRIIKKKVQKIVGEQLNRHLRWEILESLGLQPYMSVFFVKSEGNREGSLVYAQLGMALVYVDDFHGYVDTSTGEIVVTNVFVSTSFDDQKYKDQIRESLEQIFSRDMKFPKITITFTK